MSSRFHAGERVKSRDQLAIGQRCGRFGGDVAIATLMEVALGEISRETFADRPGAENQYFVARRQAVRDLRDKSIQMLEAVRLAGRLRAAPATMTIRGIVPDVARRLVVSRHFRLNPLDSSPVSFQADELGFPRVDPHK